MPHIVHRDFAECGESDGFKENHIRVDEFVAAPK
jgi:hypothetical protein